MVSSNAVKIFVVGGVGSIVLAYAVNPFISKLWSSK